MMTEYELANALKAATDALKKFGGSFMEIQEQLSVFGALLKKANETMADRLRGTDQALAALKAQVALWENHRSGCLEELSDYIVVKNVSVDAGLDEMVRRGVMPEWRDTAPNG